MALTRTPYSREIGIVATRHALPPLLVEALVLQESRGYTDAFRHEPTFWYQYLATHPLYVNAIPRRVSSSYGLCQIMYPTARDRGFLGMPEELFIPAVGLHWGCVHLRWLIDWALSPARGRASPANRLMAALAAYNGGKLGNAPTTSPKRNEPYARRVLTLYGSPTL